MGAGQPGRATLTATMSSRRVAVLDFVTAYLDEHHGVSPSLSEIAAGCGMVDRHGLPVREHARKLVDALVAEGRLLRVAGKARSLALPSTLDAAIRELRRLGCRVDEDFTLGPGLRNAFPLTFSALPELAPGFHIAGGDRAAGEGGDGAERG